MESRKAVVVVTAAGVALLVTGAATPPPPHPSASSGLAGTGPGEGRRHPGRAEPPPTRGEGGDRPSAPVPVYVEEPRDQGPAAVRTPEGWVLEVLPLGAGLVLIGLGLGFLGLRLRRGR
ncbi:hypothetical protein PV318_04000 [Streptomyces sp. ME02-6991-2B]|nr:hypothetical protein [Streptomyces sp. ME02-6991-2B]